MIPYNFPAPLYTFIDYANNIEIERKVLDCGAGGPFPKLALFALNEFETHGIEIIADRIEMAEKFQDKNKMEFNLIEGDMRNLPFENESFGFVFSYNTIFHMTKEDIVLGLNEMFRVLKKDGLLYVNLLSVDDARYGRGEEIQPKRFMERIDGEEFAHTFFYTDEGDVFFKEHEIIYKQIRKEYLIEDDYIRGMIDYIVRK